MSQAIITGSLGTMRVNVTGYSTQIAADIQSAQLQSALVHYVTKVRQNGLNLTIQCGSEKELENIQNFIIRHQSQCIIGNINTLRVIYPAVKIDMTGFFTSLDGGAQRFDFAPQLALTLLQTQGLIDSKSNIYSQAVGRQTTAQMTNPDRAELSVLGG